MEMESVIITMEQIATEPVRDKVLAMEQDIVEGETGRRVCKVSKR